MWWIRGKMEDSEEDRGRWRVIRKKEDEGVVRKMDKIEVMRKIGKN